MYTPVNTTISLPDEVYQGAATSTCSPIQRPQNLAGLLTE